MARVFGILSCGFLLWAAGVPCLAVESQSATSTASSADIFEAEADNLVTLKYIPNDAKSAQVIVVNRTNRPLTLRLPANFVGVPVLAQFGGGDGFDGGDRLAFGRGDGRDAGAHGGAIQVDGACAALRHAAAELGTGEIEQVADGPQQRHVRRCVHFVRRPIHLQFHV